MAEPPRLPTGIRSVPSCEIWARRLPCPPVFHRLWPKQHTLSHSWRPWLPLIPSLGDQEAQFTRLLRARHERPRRCCAAQECDEVAPSHAMPVEDKAHQRAALCVTASLAAKCSDGSLASDRHVRDARPMSALPPRATKHWHRSETSLCAKSRLMHCSKTPCGVAMIHSITSIPPNALPFT